MRYLDGRAANRAVYLAPANQPAEVRRVIDGPKDSDEDAVRLLQQQPKPAGCGGQFHLLRRRLSITEPERDCDTTTP